MDARLPALETALPEIAGRLAKPEARSEQFAAREDIAALLGARLKTIGDPTWSRITLARRLVRYSAGSGGALHRRERSPAGSLIHPTCGLGRFPAPAVHASQHRHRAPAGCATPVSATPQLRENPPPKLLRCTVLGIARDATMPATPWLPAGFHKKRRWRHQKRPVVGDPGTHTPRSTHECPSERRATPRARNRFPGRQIHAGARPHLYQRDAGAGAAADAAAGARSRCGAEHRRLHLRLPRLAAGGAGPGPVEGQDASVRPRHRLPGGAQ
uniref:Uncharacterized protein n=1 Tax=Ralstonia solanacearum TaxID=305 RepID=A0A0S4UCS1_RALSL|nr:conserved protein of unknown function [Ralstonia solanacearum]